MNGAEERLLELRVRERAKDIETYKEGADDSVQEGCVLWVCTILCRADSRRKNCLVERNEDVENAVAGVK
jgi:hypothetical protein